MAAVAGGTALPHGSAGATAAISTTGGAAARPFYYVAIGASESVGFQPSPAHRHGVRTDRGYTNDLAAMEQARWPGLRLVELGCPGITAERALDGQGRCRYPAGSEVATAVAFLRAHRGEAVLTTVDLGFNDVRPCLVHLSIDRPCVRAALGRVERAVPAILARVRAAGGGRMRIVGLEHSDPYVADYLHGPRGRTFAAGSVAVIGRLNEALKSIYTRGGAAVADVPAAYRTGSGGTTLAATGDARSQVARSEVARICTLTWMCRRHNLHPDTAGYRLIAKAIADALGSGRSAGG
jgi:lysophospholipase L1-like esterase